MVEEQVDDEVLPADFERHLPADEGESAAELEQEALDVIDERLLDLAFAPRIGGAEEIEQVRILEDLRGHVRVDRRQREREVALRLALAFVQAAFDLQRQNAAAPALPGTLRCVPESRLRIAQPVEEHDVLAPGEIWQQPLHNFGVRPGGSEVAHVTQVARREARHVGEGIAEIRGESIDDLRTPAFVLLASEDGAPHVPVELEHGGVGGHDGAKARLLDPRF